MDNNQEEKDLLTPEEIPQPVDTTGDAEIVEDAVTPAPQTDFVEEDFGEDVIAQTVDTAEKKKSFGAWKFILGIICGGLLAVLLVGGVVLGLVVAGVIGNTSDPGETTAPTVSNENPSAKISYTVTDEVAAEKANEVIATVGQSQLTNAMLQIFYRAEVYNFLNSYGYYLSMFGLDPSLPLDQQACYVDANMTWQEYFLENALNNWKSYAILLEVAREEGFTVSQKTQEEIDNGESNLRAEAVEAGYASLEEMVMAEAGAGATVEGFLAYQALIYTGLEYFDLKYNGMAPTADEIAAYYEENLASFEEQGITKGGIRVDVRHILVSVNSTTDENGMAVSSETDWAECRDKAQQILDQWKSGEATEESFGQLASEVTDDPGSKTNGGLYTDVVEGEMVTEFNDWIMDPVRKTGDTDLVKTQFGYHVMYFCDSEEIPTEEQNWYTTANEQILSTRFDAFYTDAEARFPIQTDYSKIVLTELSLS